MKYLALLISFIVLNCWTFAQTIKVIDRYDLQPIENVSVQNGRDAVYTNHKGEADLGSLAQHDTIKFSHSFYKDRRLPYRALVGNGFTVRLEERVINIGEIVVAANRWEEDTREVPSKISTISAREVSFANPQTAADLLSVSDEVFIQKSQLGGGSPMIRGFATKRVLLVVDGVRMNNAIYRSGNLQNVISLDAHSIANAEVIFGPGSVIYGSDAIGGVMDFHTESPQLSSNGNLKFDANTVARYSSANKERTGHLDVNLGGEKWGFKSTITYSNYDNLRMGSHNNEEYRRTEYVVRRNGQDVVVDNDDPDLQVPSGYDQFNLMQKLRFKPSEHWDLNYALHYSETSDVPRYDRLIEYKSGQPRSAEWFYGPQRWLMSALKIKHLDPGTLYDVAKLAVAYQGYEESRNDRKFGQPNLRERVETVDAYSLNLDFDKQLNPYNSLFYGAEAVINKVGSVGRQINLETDETEAVPSRYPDGSDYSAYAAYFNFKSNLNPQMTFLAGARYSQVILNAEFVTTFFSFPFTNIDLNTDALNGSVGFVYRPTPSWQFNLNGTSGFRAPNIDDVGKIFDSEPGSVVVPNEDLNSEYAYNLDLGMIKNFKNKIKINATGFYTLLKDAMVRRDFQFNGQDSIIYDDQLSRVQAVVNADEATVYGVQFALQAELSDHFSFRKNLTFTDGEDKQGLPLRHVAPLFGSAHLTYQASKIKADAYVDYNGEIPFEDLVPSERNKPHIYATDENGNPYSPAWVTLNLKIAYQFSSHLQLNLGIENLLDTRYRPYSSGIAAPGRNIMLALRSRF